MIDKQARSMYKTEDQDNQVKMPKVINVLKVGAIFNSNMRQGVKILR